MGEENGASDTYKPKFRHLTCILCPFAKFGICKHYPTCRCFYVLFQPYLIEPCYLHHLVPKHSDKLQIIFDVICAHLFQMMRVSGACLLLDPLHIIGPH